VKDEESLQARAVVGELADTVQHRINDFLANLDVNNNKNII
jgi:hypothetical protein